MSAWHEEWRAHTERVAALEAALRAGGARVRRGGGCDRWELQASAGAFGGVRLCAVVEEHGRGRQLLRVRVRPHLPRLGACAIGGLAACAASAALVAAWETTALLAAPLTALLACAVFECGNATAATLRALRGSAAAAAPPVAAASPHGVADRSLHPPLEAEESAA